MVQPLSSRFQAWPLRTVWLRISLLVYFEPLVTFAGRRCAWHIYHVAFVPRVPSLCALRHLQRKVLPRFHKPHNVKICEDSLWENAYFSMYGPNRQAVKSRNRQVAFSLATDCANPHLPFIRGTHTLTQAHLPCSSQASSGRGGTQLQ